MTDFKSAEQQVRETLGWDLSPSDLAESDYLNLPQALDVYNLAVSKTAELLEMTVQRARLFQAGSNQQDELIKLAQHCQNLERQRDEAQKALEIANAELEHFKRSGIVEVAVRNPSVADYCQHWESRAESAEATIREQAERITKMRDALETIEASLCACRKLICNCHACFSKRTAAEALRGKQ